MNPWTTTLHVGQHTAHVEIRHTARVEVIESERVLRAKCFQLAADLEILAIGRPWAVGIDSAKGRVWVSTQDGTQRVALALVVLTAMEQRGLPFPSEGV